jgi:hypothetical protein
MGLSNASKNARNYSQIIVQNQGGGSKKAGLKPTVGKDYHRAVQYKANLGIGRCCPLTSLRLTANPNICVSRPVGANVQFNSYFKRC